MTRVLFLSWWNPIPPDIGARVRVLALLRALVDAGHAVDLLSFSEPEADVEEAGSELSRLGIASVFVRRSIHARNRLRQIGVRLSAALARKPYPAAVSESREMRRAVRDALRAKSYQVAFAETSWMGQYLTVADSPRKILSWQNVDFEVYGLRAASEKLPILRALRRYNFRAARRFELDLVRKFDAVITVTEADRLRLREALPAAPPVYVLPVSVDIERFPYQPTSATEGNRLLFVGSMFYQPNVDAMLHFHREVYPLIRARRPAARLTIVGKDPAAAIRRLAERDHSVSVTGTVPQVEDFYRDADLFVAPIRFGGGMKTKVIEAMAHGVPVVGSSTAFEGISVTDGREAAVCDPSEGFARSVVHLLESPAARREMSLCARRLVEERYSQTALARALAEIIAGMGPA